MKHAGVPDSHVGMAPVTVVVACCRGTLHTSLALVTTARCGGCRNRRTGRFGDRDTNVNTKIAPTAGSLAREFAQRYIDPHPKSSPDMIRDANTAAKRIACATRESIRERFAREETIR